MQAAARRRPKFLLPPRGVVTAAWAGARSGAGQPARCWPLLRSNGAAASSAGSPPRRLRPCRRKRWCQRCRPTRTSTSSSTASCGRRRGPSLPTATQAWSSAQQTAGATRCLASCRPAVPAGCIRAKHAGRLSREAGRHPHSRPARQLPGVPFTGCSRLWLCTWHVLLPLRPLPGLPLPLPLPLRLMVYSSVGDATRCWIKGRRFSLAGLLGDAEAAQAFEGGSLAIFRLVGLCFCLLVDLVFFQIMLLFCMLDAQARALERAEGIGWTSIKRREAAQRADTTARQT